MLFSMKNTQTTFSLMINHGFRNVEGVATYVEGIVVYSESWKQHISTLEKMFSRLGNVYLNKSEFGQATLN